MKRANILNVHGQTIKQNTVSLTYKCGSLLGQLYLITLQSLQCQISKLSLLSIAFICPGAAEIRANKSSEANNAKEDNIPSDITKIDFGLKDVPRYLKDIFTNWSFILVSVYICCDMGKCNIFQEEPL